MKVHAFPPRIRSWPGVSDLKVSMKTEVLFALLGLVAVTLQGCGCGDDAKAWCACLVGCEVIGGSADDCDDSGEVKDGTDSATKGAAAFLSAPCDVAKCMAYCGNACGHADSKTTSKAGCEGIKQMATDCDAACDGASRAFSIAAVPAIIAMAVIGRA